MLLPGRPCFLHTHKPRRLESSSSKYSVEFWYHILTCLAQAGRPLPPVDMTVCAPEGKRSTSLCGVTLWGGY